MMAFNKPTKKHLVAIIGAIRDSNPDAVRLYTEGECYRFSLILRNIVGQANHEIWHDCIEGHVYSKIGQYWYDIRGVHYKVNRKNNKKLEPDVINCANEMLIDGFKRLNHQDRHRPHRWGSK
ncbi:MAG: hypothetical protein ACJAYB_000038 [Psychromonas sp.]|jgi:hypothetical protein